MEKQKILSFGLTIILLASIIFISGCISQPTEEPPEAPGAPPEAQLEELLEEPEPPTCPASCDDKDACTQDHCSLDTNYECKNDQITPCCGNDICESGESYESCPRDCEKPAQKPAEENETKETPVPSVVTAVGPVKISAFNIHKFGKSKMKDDYVMSVLIRIMHQFDVIFVQEVMDQSTATYFLDKINAGGNSYGFTCSPLLGRSNTVEHYCYFWNTKKVRLIKDSNYVYNDVGNLFVREPYIASFKSGNFDFTLVGINTRASGARSEIANLVNVVTSVLEKNPDEKDVIVLGNLNADGTFFDENDHISPLALEEFHWVITNEMNTMTEDNYTYDRMIMMDATFNHEYVNNSAGVFYFDKKYEIIKREFVEVVSDHYPIYAEFRTNLADDD